MRHQSSIATEKGILLHQVPVVRTCREPLRSLGGYKSVNEVLLDLIRHQRMARMDGSLELLRERAKATADVDVDHLVERLNLAPFRV